MSSRKARSRQNPHAQQQPQQLQVHHQHHHHHFPPQPSDYETDTAAQLDLLPPPPLRTNADLNLSVLKRHEPDVISILSIAHYAVVYLFSPTTQQWEKCGIEGTLFVCQLANSYIGSDRYSVVILNRRGLDNFMTELLSADDVEITEDYIILQITGADGMPQVFGLWIFSEPPPSSTADARRINAQIILDCATQAELSRKALEQRQLELQNGNGHAQAELVTEDEYGEQSEDDDPTSAPMGRQISLRELFGKQREQDSGWSVHAHHSPQTKSASQFVTTADTDFFRNYTPQKQGQVQHIPQQQAPEHPSAPQPDVLGDLFRKAKQGYHGNG